MVLRFLGYFFILLLFAPYIEAASRADNIANRQACAQALQAQNFRAPTIIDKTFKSPEEFGLWAAHYFIIHGLASDKVSLYSAGLKAPSILGPNGFFKTKAALLESVRGALEKLDLATDQRDTLLREFDTRTARVVKREEENSPAPEITSIPERLAPQIERADSLARTTPAKRSLLASRTAELVRDQNALLRRSVEDFFARQLVVDRKLDFSQPALQSAVMQMFTDLKKAKAIKDLQPQTLLEYRLEVFGSFGPFKSIFDLLAALEDRVTDSQKINGLEKLALKSILSAHQDELREKN